MVSKCKTDRKMTSMWWNLPWVCAYVQWVCVCVCAVARSRFFRANGLSKDLLPLKVFTRKDKRPQIEMNTQKRWNVHNGYVMLTQFLPKFIISNQSKWILIKWISLSSASTTHSLAHTHTRAICSFRLNFENWED